MAGMNILLFVCVLICPVIAIVTGFILMKNPPKEINNTVGYRTRRSKSSQEAWDFANVYSGKCTMIYGVISLIIGAALDYYLVYMAGVNALFAMILVITLELVGLIIAMLVPTERKLKEKFGE